MAKWALYVYERCPPLIYGSLALGIVLSGSFLFQKNTPFLQTVLAFVGVWVFLFCSQLSQDIQSFAKDKIAFPDRLLPAGKISLADAKQLLFILSLVSIAYSQFIWVFVNEVAALIFLLLVIWGVLSYHFFYRGPIRGKFPLLMVLVQPLSIVLLMLFAVSVATPAKVFNVKALALALALYGTMLTYRLCMTFNPHLHPISADYIHFYGFQRTFYLALFGVFIAIICAGILRMGGLLWPIDAILIGAMLLQFVQPLRYKGAEMAAAASLVIHAWSGIF